MVTQQEPSIVIELSKSKNLQMLAGCIGFIIASGYIWHMADIKPFPLLSPTALKVLAVLGVVFFGPLCFYAIYKLFDKVPGLVLNQEGLVDNASAVGGKLIFWKDIVRVEEISVMNNHFLMIHVRNPEEILAQVNLMKRWLMQMNYKQYGTPVTISTSVLKCNFNELAFLIRTQLKKHNPEAEV